LTTAGMHPLVPHFLGAPHPLGKRIFDTQKCFRTPDIDEVGDDTHHTFFEMLGNWSFGDYFKKEAIELAFDFFVKILKFDPTKFGVTIFAGDVDAPRDDEAEKIWLSKGLQKSQIYEFDKKDNFWGPAGKTGPCGPCTEIHIDRGEKFGCGKNCGPNCENTLKNGKPCQRFVEAWNLVFMEFNKTADGKYEKLAQKNVDTGAGFERVLSILNSVESTFDTDIFENILRKIAELSGANRGLKSAVNGGGGEKIAELSNVNSGFKRTVHGDDAAKNWREKYSENLKAFRVVADHLRGAVFLISDGVRPGNGGRDYILRRIIRRAILWGEKLNLPENFPAEITKVIISDFADEYPELRENEKQILEVLQIEEKNFRATLQKDEKKLAEILAQNPTQISGKIAFELFDTFGFPIELTEEIAAEKNLKVDRAEFEKFLNEQKKRARENSKKMFDRDEDFSEFEKLPPTKFDREKSELSAKILFAKKSENSPEIFFVAFDETPFYATSGGQLSDRGTAIFIPRDISGDNEVGAEVLDVFKNSGGVFLHKISFPLNGGFQPAAAKTANLKIDANRRAQTARHHSLAHFLQAALREILDKNICQAGSEVSQNRARFDFNFPRNLTADEIRKIENKISEFVAADADKKTTETEFKNSQNLGAISLFGEKFADDEIVRVVQFGDFSTELCGGTHAKNSAEIGAVKILSESGVAAGVRRIEICCGAAAEKLFLEKCATVENLAKKLKTPVENLEKRIDEILGEKKSAENSARILQNSLAKFEAENLAKNFREISGVKFVVFENKNINGGLKPAVQGNLARKIAKKISGVAIGFSENGNLVVAAEVLNSGLKPAVSAKNLAQKLFQKFGGGGGGSEKFASGGGAAGISAEKIWEELLK